MLQRLVRLAAAAMAVAAPLGAQAGGLQTDATPSQSREHRSADCFYVNQLQGDHALSDRSVLFRVSVSDFWRLDFAQSCPALLYPAPRLILTPVGGIGVVCHAIDLDVSVAQQGPGSIPEPCIPTGLHHLTPAEAAALPRKDLP
jgi:hypothetical protein